VTDQITVVIPTIPPREHYLGRAIRSVSAQTHPATNIVVVNDHAREGAPANRQRGLEMVQTEWVAFLDDDDEFYPDHLEKLLRCAKDEGADYVYSWYDVIGGIDPRAEQFGLPWDPENPRQTTITTLIRTELAQQVGFVVDGDTPETLESPDRMVAGEDWWMTKGCNDLGAKIVHLPEKTWAWYHTGRNTSGLPKNW
jgi:hypothetical protein